MYRHTQQGQGPPAPFVPASQQQHRGSAQPNNTAALARSRAIPIVSPSIHSSPDAKTAAATASPLKGALSAKAASAAVFVPKGGASTPHISAAQSHSVDQEYEEHKAPTQMMHEINIGVDQQQTPQQQQTFHHHGVQAFNPYLTSESGRGTPNSFNMGGYDTDGSSNVFDPTYMGPLPPASQQQQTGNQADVHVQGGAQTRGMTAGAGAATGAGSTGRAYNPYEHLNEFGEPTNASSTGIPGSGIDFFGGSSAHTAAAAAKLRQPLLYHLYSPAMPHVSNLHPQHLSANAFFMNSAEREELQRKNEALHAGVPPPELGGPKLPEELHVYHSLVPLEPCPLPGVSGNSILPQLVDPSLVPPTTPGTVNLLTGACGEASRVFGYRCHVYKAQCTLDGKYYVLRRLENFRLTHEAAIALVERWRRIRHPSIVSVREAFTTRAFGDSSIVFVYDYHPLAATLYAEHMVAKPPQPDRRTGRMQTKSMQVSERTLWSYLCQLTNVVRSIHQHGLAVRCIEPSKVIRTGKNRIRINCCSIFDVIAYDPNATQSTLQAHQSEDLVNMGKLLLSLACNSVAAVQNMQRSLDQIARTFSADFNSVVLWLVSPAGSVALPRLGGGGGNGTGSRKDGDRQRSPSADGEPSSATPTTTQKDVEQLQRLLGVKFAEEFDSALNHNDLLESDLSKELENARLVRLLCKFGFINERPEFDHDPRWSETGDRYIVKLFRDHVFHAVDAAGRPVVDLTHILTNLNKLDAGSLEKIMLTSRDEQSCLVVSYREIKHCIDSAFADLSRAR